MVFPHLWVIITGCPPTSHPTELPRSAAHVVWLKDPTPAAVPLGTWPSLTRNLLFNFQRVTEPWWNHLLPIITWQDPRWSHQGSRVSTFHWWCELSKPGFVHVTQDAGWCAEAQSFANSCPSSRMKPKDVLVLAVTTSQGAEYKFFRWCVSFPVGYCLHYSLMSSACLYDTLTLPAWP